MTYKGFKRDPEWYGSQCLIEQYQFDWVTTLPIVVYPRLVRLTYQSMHPYNSIPFWMIDGIDYNFSAKEIVSTLYLHDSCPHDRGLTHHKLYDRTTILANMTQGVGLVHNVARASHLP